ncbi:4-hydroxy-tetrahydrodipicolinate reductase [Legionella sp. km772]|uniref:4-hydroxy-tetrahydrodipicolinate reductase n=1 Tax=Legionella sp. km772 TaxID=2498111 RepID=UPI000F8F5399|nr:4-hydroxy-tetrahydrodipicolinate reductase [Legionella sp. km772]RUR12881.1 4-hydroxy-tetrahydrodipicolinate reductase [Legionella sp. km772]
MPIRVIVNGAKGKMGSLACTTLATHPEFNLVAQLGRNDNLAATIKTSQAQIVVDLTRADCVYENSLTIIESGARPVIGASGLGAEEVAELNQRCQQQALGGIITPNFSIGAVLMMICAAKVAEYFPEVEIIEAHHQQKLDAPSGTALKTAEMIASARQLPKNELALKELIPGARGGAYEGINLHSLRLPGILARQEVLFGSQGESLSITHNSLDRQCFMPGIVLACQKVMQLNHLVYGLESVL